MRKIESIAIGSFIYIPSEDIIRRVEDKKVDSFGTIFITDHGEEKEGCEIEPLTERRLLSGAEISGVTRMELDLDSYWSNVW